MTKPLRHACGTTPAANPASPRMKAEANPARHNGLAPIRETHD
jgi:hypothetical protein